MRVAAYFHGMPDDALDQSAHAIFEAHGGEFVGAGNTLIGAAAGERDIQYNFPADRADRADRAEACKEALVASGFRLEPTREAA